MQEERERGRIIGLRQRRLATAEWAASFVPLLAEARRELPIYADTGEPSQDAYARWLTENGILTRRQKKIWRSESVRRLFDIHIGLIDEAERVNRRPKRTPYRRAKGTPFVEQRDGYDGRFVRAGCGVGRA
jgi:hypothetical protein